MVNQEIINPGASRCHAAHLYQWVVASFLSNWFEVHRTADLGDHKYKCSEEDRRFLLFSLVSCPNHQHNNHIEHNVVYITILWFQEFSLTAGCESSKSYQFIEMKKWFKICKSFTYKHVVVLNCICWIITLSILNVGVVIFNMQICFPAYPQNLVAKVLSSLKTRYFLLKNKLFLLKILNKFFLDFLNFLFKI